MSVVVDYGELRGGVDLFCDRNGAGKTASQVMSSAGISWQYTSGQPFMCRIQGLPGSDRESCSDTPPADAYWGLFWSDGTPQTWSYATQGAASLRVPNGGSIGWRFQNGGDRESPSAPPTAPPEKATSPRPPSKPTPTPTPEKSSSAGSGAGAAPTPTRASATTDSGPAGSAPTASAAMKPRAGARTAPEDARRPKAKPTRDERPDRGVVAEPEGDEESGEPEGSVDPAALAESELSQPVDPVSADSGAAGALLPALLAALVAAGLGGYGLVVARRRRT